MTVSVSDGANDPAYELLGFWNSPKAINKENLLSGVDDDRALMLPGTGSYGQAALPELSQYSENSEAYVTTTGGDPQYYIWQPSELLNGGEIIAY